MKKISSLVVSGLMVGLFATGASFAADPQGDDVGTVGEQNQSQAGVPVSQGVREPGHPPQGDHDLETIGKKTNNPVGSAWMLWTQNDFTVMDGDASEHEENWNSLKFQPVMSFPIKLGDDPWNLIFRPAFQFQSFSIVGDRTTNIGDTGLDIALGPDRTDGVIWGLGIASIFPTAAEDGVGQGKYQAGPAVLLSHLAPNVGGFNVGVFGQHFWSYAGDDDRPDTSLTDIQYFIQYRLSKTETLGMAPNIQYDWEADSDNALKLPIGLGYQNVTRVGSTAIKYGLEFQYYVVQPDDFGPVWNLRFIFVPVVQSPFHR